MTDSKPARVFRFGPFEVDLANHQLFRNGISVTLTGQPFEILALLLEHPGQLVTRDQLRARLWPSGTVVEFEHSITVAITKLREALGDDPQHPRFIATVPRHGYRFIASVSTPAHTPAELAPNTSDGTASPTHPPAAQQRHRRAWVYITMLAVLAVGLAYVVVGRLWISRHSSAVSGAQGGARAASSTTAVAFNPPPHSIAVLPFVNLSGDKEQEYFSDGLSDELLNSLSRINELQVAARTSSFYFKGEHADLATIAHKLNVASVLEGSVRRSGQRIRVTAQLNDALTGYHLWSQTYDRDLGDVLKLQTDIATAVASALKVALLGDVATKIEVGGTRNAAAFDAYLRGRKTAVVAHSEKEWRAAIAAYTEALRLDPNYALAFAERSITLSTLGGAAAASETAKRESSDKAKEDADKAIALAPDLGEGHLARALYLEHVGTLVDYRRLNEEFVRARALAPNNAGLLEYYAYFATYTGNVEAGIAAARRAVVLDPLNHFSYLALGAALYEGRQYKEALAAFEISVTLDPQDPQSYVRRGFAFYALGDFDRARASCEREPEPDQVCLALAYDKLGRHADAEAALSRVRASWGDRGTLQYAEVYAQWGDNAQALKWLEAAKQVQGGVLLAIFIHSPLLDPLREEPRFQAIERELNFPKGPSNLE
jgi:TolB-like protein/DNA-binding winged helix-turn-helix (wHTH) protein